MTDLVIGVMNPVTGAGVTVVVGAAAGRASLRMETALGSGLEGDILVVVLTV